MTEKRPALARKHTRSSEAKKDAELDETIEAVVDGETYKLTPSDLTGVHEMRIRKETGMSVYEIVETIRTRPGIDVLGMFMWICRMSQGDNVDLMDILESVSYGSDVDVIEHSEPDPPEA